MCVQFCSGHGGVKMTSKPRTLHSHLILRCDITGGEKYERKTHSTTEMQTGNDSCSSSFFFLLDFLSFYKKSR